MKKKKVAIKNEVGLHARPAAIFVQTANKYLCDIYLETDEKKANGKSIMSVMSLGAYQGEELTIITKGEDEEEALNALVDLIENKLID